MFVAEDRKSLPDYVRFTLPIWLGYAGLLGACLLTVEPLLCAVSLTVLACILNLLWRRGEPPVLMLCCGVQWLQVSAALFYALVAGVWPEGQAGAGELREATVLGLTGVAVLALGMRVALRIAGGPRGSLATEHFAALSPQPCFAFYLLAFCGAILISSVRFAVPQVTQLLTSLMDAKWIAFFLLGLSVTSHRRNYRLLLIAALIEFSIGWLGFFSSFKQVLFPLLLIGLTVRDRLSPRRLVAAALIAACFLPFIVFWSAIKVDHRDALSEGSAEQKTTISVQDRIENLLTLGGSADQMNWAEGWDRLISRIAYVDMFAKTLEHIPGSLEHSDGLLWMRSLRHIFQPRLLFPNKESIDDSEITRFCTGMYAGAEQGTSISVGYVAESYADFGIRGMFVPVFLLGCLLGLVYCYFAYYTSNPPIGIAIGSILLVFRAQLFESSNIKILGSVVSTFFIMALMEKLFGPALVQYLRRGILNDTASKISEIRQQPANPEFSGRPS